jgi:four helix bundle protein
MDLVEAVYILSASFPPDERFGLTSQVRRAVVSVPSNIAEGHRRESTKDYLNYVSIAQSSLGEVETQLEIAARLKYISQEQLQVVIKAVSGIGRQLYALRNALVHKS